jgi:uncharacterized protein YneF (UPF0154 family)
MLPTIEWSLNIGTVLVIIFSAGGFYFVTRMDMKALKDNVIAIKEDLKVLNKAVADIAVQDARISALRSSVELLERRFYDLLQSLNGEWPKK